MLWRVVILQSSEGGDIWGSQEGGQWVLAGRGEREDPDRQLFTERRRNTSALDNHCCRNTDGDQLDTNPCQNPVPRRVLSPQKALGQRDLSYITSPLPPSPDHRGALKYSLLDISRGTFSNILENQDSMRSVAYPPPRCYRWHFLFGSLTHLSLCRSDLNSSAGT